MTIILNPDPCVVMRRLLANGTMLDIHAMTFGKYRLYVGPQDALWYDDGW